MAIKKSYIDKEEVLYDFCKENYYKIFYLDGKRLDERTTILTSIYICDSYQVPTAQSFLLNVQGWNITELWREMDIPIDTLMERLKRFVRESRKFSISINHNRDFRIIDFK